MTKEDGSERILGILCLEDKVVEQALEDILSRIYEADFRGFSYAFRPGRSQHDALDALAMGIRRRKGNCVLDLDIRKFSTGSTPTGCSDCCSTGSAISGSSACYGNGSKWAIGMKRVAGYEPNGEHRRER